MKSELTNIWNVVTNVFAKEQSPYIMSYYIFASYFIHKKRVQISEIDIPEEVQISETDLPRNVRISERDLPENPSLINLAEIEDNEVKKSIFRLEKAIDWVYMSDYLPAKRLSETLLEEMEQLHIYTIEDVNQRMKELQYLLVYKNGFTYTPESLVQLITKFALVENADSIADMCCGFSTMGLEIWNALKKSDTDVEFQAVDNNQLCCDISNILAWINGIHKYQVKMRDILEPETEKISKADLIVADIPKGMNETYELFMEEKRFLGYKKRTVYTDWVFGVDVLEHLNEDGKAFVIMTKGALVRRNERELRKIFVENDFLDAVITLPPNLFSDTNIAMELVIFRRKKEKINQTFFADLSKFAEKTHGGKNKISNKGIDLAVENYLNHEKECEDSIGRWISTKKIIEAEYSFNSMIYLELEKIQNDMGKSVPLGEVAQIIRGVQINKSDEVTLRKEPTHYLLNVKDIEQGKIDYKESSRIKGKNPLWDEKYQICEDDIIITTKGSLIKVAIVPPNPQKAYIMGNLTIVRAKKKQYHPYILYEFLISEEGKKSMEGIQTGSTIKVLNVSQLGKMRVPDMKQKNVGNMGKN